MKHYNHHQWRGTLPARKTLTNATDRYEHWIERGGSNACWLWTGATSSGYGILAVEGRQEYVHRWAYRNFVGPIPEGLIIGHVCHDLDLTCRNVRAGRNSMLTRERGRIRRETRTHCRKGHELTEENLYIRPRDGAHCCRACTAAAADRYRLKTVGDAPKNHPRNRTHCPQGHEYDNVNSQGARTCKRCDRDTQERYRERLRARKASALAA